MTGGQGVASQISSGTRFPESVEVGHLSRVFRDDRSARRNRRRGSASLCQTRETAMGKQTMRQAARVAASQMYAKHHDRRHRRPAHFGKVPPTGRGEGPTGGVRREVGEPDPHADFLGDPELRIPLRLSVSDATVLRQLSLRRSLHCAFEVRATTLGVRIGGTPPSESRIRAQNMRRQSPA